jgi:pyruvate dehydrogenase E2 component (dihydrolipoamide acetyltransferase)
MAIEIVMPQLGLTMTEGVVVKWLKKVGDQVKKGDALFEVETDKVTQEVTSLEEGVLGEVLVGEGVSVPIGQVIAYLTAPGEKVAVAPRAGGDGATGGRGDGTTERTRDSGLSTQHQAGGTALPAALSSETWVRASPAAKKLAQKLGVDYRALKGSGPGGRIVEADVRRAAAAVATPIAKAAPAAAPSLALPATPAVPAGELVELKGMRKVVAERMALSFSTAPHFYLTVEVDATALKALHQQVVSAIQKRYGVQATLTDLLIKAVAVALREHPEANSSWVNGAIQRNSAVNLGVAASVGDGLIVPVIPAADRLSLGQIAQKRRELVEKARSGRLTLPDLEGGTFTLSNLGMFGIDQFQAIVNPPQAAILAVGRIKDRVVPVDGQVAVRPTMYMTLSVDHRVMDGADGAKFLARVVELLEQPMELLLGD